MGISIQPSKISLDQNSGKVVIEYLPYDSDLQEFKRAVGFSKKVEIASDELASEIKNALVQIGVDKQNVTPDEPNAEPTIDQILEAKLNMIQKNSNLIIREFIKENILLGIEQRGLTEQVLNASKPVLDALVGLSPKVAILRLKEVDQNLFDGVILSAERLKGFRNKIEKMLGYPLADEWNSPPTW